ncbi:MAG TPA: YceI family protein [Thermoanaerobaculia bacterium]|nr:YceI family protein [Thermoanaerobaculia bacterium]
MKSRIRSVAAGLAVLLAIAASAAAAPETFVFDKAHTKVGFQIRHWLTKVDGRFRDFDGKIVIDRGNPANSKVDVTIQAASIDTSNERRDADLKSANFFDVEKFPTITFRSSKVEPKGKDLYDVTGDMTMHGVTKTVKVPVRHTGFLNLGRVEKAGFEVAFPIDRKDFGITWNRTADQGGVMLGDDVDITLLIEANRELTPPVATPAAPAEEATKAPSHP